MPKPPAPVKTGAEFLKSARDVAFIIAIYLYFAGWIYIYTYFNFFGVSMRETDMEFYYFLVYSVNVMSYLIVGHWFITSCIIIASIATVHWVRHTWVIYVICTVLFGLLYYSSILSATADAKTDYVYKTSQLLKIKFVLKDEKEPAEAPRVAAVPKNPNDTAKVKKPIAEDIAKEFKTYNDQNKLRLLLSSKDEYLVLLADTAVKPDNTDSKIKIAFTIKKENVSLVKIKK
jgi:hypothetical protein